ncbi:MAG: hypothetical protein K1W22_12260 [Lachnospiraceae bacterium]
MRNIILVKVVAENSIRNISLAIYAVLLIICTFVINWDNKKYRVKIKRYSEKVNKAMWYLPYLCSMLIGFSVICKIRWIAITGAFLVFTCEILSFFLFDNVKRYEYSYVVLYFDNGSEMIYRTEDVKQKGNWIIAIDIQKSYEMRYRKKDLVKVKYFNEIKEEDYEES